MTRSAARGMSSNARTISASRRPLCVLDRDRRPHPLLELAPELLDEHLLVLADLDVALGDQLLAISRAHAQELHAGIMSRASRQPVRRPVPGRPRRARSPGPAPGRCRGARRAPPPTRACARPAPPPRGLNPSARCAASALECVHPTHAPRRRDAARPGSNVMLVPSKNTSVTSSRCPPVTTTFAGPSPCSARARSSTSSRPAASTPRHADASPPRAAAPRPPTARAASAPAASTRASGRFGVITVASGSSSRHDRRARLVVEQHRAGLGDHHRVNHDWHAVLDVTERLADRAHRLRRPEHADLDRVDADVGGHRPDLLDDELARDRVDRGHADGALRGQRRDRGHPVHAAAGEGLQVGLDTGAAAGVRAGDREHGRYGSRHRGSG